MKRQRWLVLLCCAGALAVGIPDVAQGQRRDTAAARAQLEGLGLPGLSQAEIVERLRASGMTRAQARAELQRRGYDPSLADPYFDIIEREAGAPGGRTRDEFIRALEEMGLAADPRVSGAGGAGGQRGAAGAAGAGDSLGLRRGGRAGLLPDDPRLPDDDDLRLADSLGLADPRLVEVLRSNPRLLEALRRAGATRDERFLTDAPAAALPGAEGTLADAELEALLGMVEADLPGAAGRLEVFGRSFFRRAGGQVDVPAYGPVDASYRLGPGDEVNVVLTGAVQDAYALRVDREGLLIVPEAGQVVANGLTLAALENVLRARLANVYAGVGTGPDALTRVSVSLGRVRTHQVYVIGDVERPGALQVSALGTVLSALYRAGGPRETGSFREIEVRRGSELVRRFDLYDYLLYGNSQADLRLEHGDVIFVPPVARRVRLEGAIKRPGIYELVEGDSLRDAIRFAGGPEAAAALRRVQIDRILPPSERAPGVERVLVDVDVARLLAPDAPDVALADGDEVRVFSVSEERRNLVSIVGEVRRPGWYAWTEGTTLGQVLERASGLTEQAYRARAHVYRLDPGTRARRLVSVPLDPELAGQVVLADRDSVVVYSRERLRTREYVTVGGRVKRPGRYPLAEGATVHDLILAAGGFTEGAYQLEAYVARPRLGQTVGDSLADAYVVPLVPSGGGAAGELAAAAAADAAVRAPGVSGEAPAWRPAEGEFVLRHGDRIEVRLSPGYEPARTVLLTGEVRLPGRYALETRSQRLSSLLAAAGGLTAEAFAAGAQVVRQGDVVPADLPRALQQPGSAADLMLQPGDSIHVPRFEPTVLVTGAVAYRTRVPHRPGMSIGDYIRQAGGFAATADRGRTTVTYANGRRAVVRRRALLPDGNPPVEPGAVIFVPERPPGLREGFNWGTLFSQVVAAAGAAATLVIALDNR